MRLTRKCNGRRSSLTGAVLLEVVLALMLFVAAATVIASALRASSLAVERLRLSTHASNLAVSFLSELELGIRPTETAGPENFEAPYENWTWELIVRPAEEKFSTTSRLQIVEVIIRHDSGDSTYRLAQILPPHDAAEDEDLFSHRPNRSGQPRVRSKVGEQEVEIAKE